jgi:hypothetical protein
VFTIPGKGQFHCNTSPMGLLGCPASFQWLMEGVLCSAKTAHLRISDGLPKSRSTICTHYGCGHR